MSDPEPMRTAALDLAKKRAKAIDDYLAPFLESGINFDDCVLEQCPINIEYSPEGKITATQLHRLRPKTDAELRAGAVMGDIQRWEISVPTQWKWEDDAGGWVTYSDHIAAVSAAEQQGYNDALGDVRDAVWLRDVMRGFMFDGDEDGTFTMKVSVFLDEFIGIMRDAIDALRKVKP